MLRKVLPRSTKFLNLSNDEQAGERMTTSPSWAALVLAGLCRLWAVRVEERALGLPRSGLGLVGLREILSFVVYVVACSGRTVVWRGRRFVVRSDGTLDQVEGSHA